MEMKKQRLVWVDQLKALGMFFVIWGHSVQRCANKVILQGIYCFHMPFFFILSGLTFNPDKYETVWEFMKSKAKTVLYPYVMLSFAMLPMWYFNRSIGAVQDDSILRIIIGIFYSNAAEFRATINAAWFLVTLFFGEVIFYLVHKYMKEERLILITSFVLSLLAVVASHGDELHLAPFHLDVAFVAQFYICGGSLIKKHFNKIMETIALPGKYIGVIMLLGVSFFFGYINRIVDISNMRYGNYIYMLISSYGVTISLIYIFKSLPKIPIFSPLLSYIGKNTMIFLALHIPILRCLQHYIPIIEHSRLYGSITAVCMYIGILCICPLFNKCLPFLLRFPKRRKIE